MRRETHTFDERGRRKLARLKATQVIEYVPVRTLPWPLPKEGGYEETTDVRCTSIETEIGGRLVTVRRSQSSWPQWMWQMLDTYCCDQVEPLTLN